MLCGFIQIEYDEMVDEDEECTCDATGEDGCPAHYPIDDGSVDGLKYCGRCHTSL